MGILRLILAISVLIAHSSPIFGLQFVGSSIAVKSFYIISGFYMSLILNEKYIGVNGSYKLFISNRLLRLFPIYWTVLILTLLLSIGTLISSKSNYLGSLSNFITYFDKMSVGSFTFLAFTNIFLLFQDMVMFLGLNTSTGNLFFTPNFHATDPQLYKFLFIPQAWTIGVEITFYLLAPLLVRKNLFFIFPLILLSLMLRVVLSMFGLNNDPWTYRFFPSELFFFLLGVVSYRIYVYIRKIEIRALYQFLIFGFVILYTLFLSDLPIRGRVHLYFLSFFICLPFIFHLTKDWRFDNYIGELSYPVYISHVLVFTCMINWRLPLLGCPGLSLTILCILFSLLLNVLIAKKVEKFRKSRTRSVADVSQGIRHESSSVPH